MVVCFFTANPFTRYLDKTQTRMFVSLLGPHLRPEVCVFSHWSERIIRRQEPACGLSRFNRKDTVAVFGTDDLLASMYRLCATRNDSRRSTENGEMGCDTGHRLAFFCSSFRVCHEMTFVHANSCTGACRMHSESLLRIASTALSEKRLGAD